MGAAIQAVLSWNDENRKQISELAKMRASQFSWDCCAEKTLEGLRKAIAFYNNKIGKGK